METLNRREYLWLTSAKLKSSQLFPVQEGIKYVMFSPYYLLISPVDITLASVRAVVSSSRASESAPSTGSEAESLQCDLSLLLSSCLVRPVWHYNVILDLNTIVFGKVIVQRRVPFRTFTKVDVETNWTDWIDCHQHRSCRGIYLWCWSAWRLLKELTICITQ